MSGQGGDLLFGSGTEGDGGLGREWRERRSVGTVGVGEKDRDLNRKTGPGAFFSGGFSLRSLSSSTYGGRRVLPGPTPVPPRVTPLSVGRTCVLVHRRRLGR